MSFPSPIRRGLAALAWFHFGVACSGPTHWAGSVEDRNGVEVVANPGEPLREGQEPTAFTTEPLRPLPEEEGVQCSDLSAWGGGAARLRFTTPQIQVFNAEGDLVREITLDLPVEPVTEAERNAALEALRGELSSRGLPPPFIEQSLVVNEERWTVKCRFGPLRFDATRPLAAILEQNPEELGSGNATLHLLSEDGLYLARVSFSAP